MKAEPKEYPIGKQFRDEFDRVYEWREGSEVYQGLLCLRGIDQGDWVWWLPHKLEVIDHETTSSDTWSDRDEARSQEVYEKIKRLEEEIERLKMQIDIKGWNKKQQKQPPVTTP